MVDRLNHSYTSTGNIDSSINFTTQPSLSPSFSPTLFVEIDNMEETHDIDAYTALVLNISLITCVMFAYFIKVYKIYYLSDSGAAILFGAIIGGIARLTVEDLSLLSFSPEVFFFVLLPPIIFEAGYSLHKQKFFENLGAITLYAMFGTIISTFFVGYLIYFFAKMEIITGIDASSPIEPLLFGSLIAAVDPVATLSILGNPELQCDPLLYSLVFGESVLNDAISIALFHTIKKYYKPISNEDDHSSSTDFSESDLPSVFLSFLTLSALSISVGIGLGLVVSFIYRHTSLTKFPKLETTLLFLFCYLCYATAEAFDLSGILALFFHGIVLSHYNSYNLSPTAHVTSDQIFATLATVTETIVYFYMGMGVFTGKFRNWNITFTLWALLFCVIARAFNIFPLSFIANCCRRRNKISIKMQGVMWFTGLRGAIAFALSENMPGPHRDTYASATLSICIFTTIVCGGCTEKILSVSGLKNQDYVDVDDADHEQLLSSADGDDEYYTDMIKNSPIINHVSTTVQEGAKGMWKNFDDNYLQQWFGGAHRAANLQSLEKGGGRKFLHQRQGSDDLGDYELNRRYESDDDEDNTSL